MTTSANSHISALTHELITLLCHEIIKVNEAHGLDSTYTSLQLDISGTVASGFTTRLQAYHAGKNSTPGAFVLGSCLPSALAESATRTARDRGLTQLLITKQSLLDPVGVKALEAHDVKTPPSVYDLYPNDNNDIPF